MEPPWSEHTHSSFSMFVSTSLRGCVLLLSSWASSDEPTAYAGPGPPYCGHSILRGDLRNENTEAARPGQAIVVVPTIVVGVTVPTPLGIWWWSLGLLEIWIIEHTVPCEPAGGGLLHRTNGDQRPDLVRGGGGGGPALPPHENHAMRFLPS